jgi:WXXGXW repeat (2 copies)
MVSSKSVLGLSVVVAVFSFLLITNARAQSVTADPNSGEGVATTRPTAPAIDAPAATAPNGPQHFEIIDGSSQITGDSDPLKDGANKKWKTACDDWKKETKDLNKGNQVIAISCGSSACATGDSSAFTCSSMGSYKVKVAGTRVPEPPAPPPPPTEQVFQTAPPPVIVEAAPEPRPGFVWVVGYWGWVGGSHMWIPGRWIVDRPGYMWYGNRWVRRGPGWGFESGHWGRRY